MNRQIENILKNIPLPIAGLAFGLTGLGGLFAEFGQGMWAQPLFGLLGFAILLIPLGKMLFFPQIAKENLKNPIQAAVAPVIPFTLMLDAGYLSQSLPNIAFAVWLLATIVATIYVIWFVWQYIFHFQLKNVFAAFFIPFVGFCLPVMTSLHLVEDFPFIAPLREWLFNLATFLFIIMFTVISVRYLRLPVSENAAKPVFTIYAAPMAMLIVCYSRLPIEHSTTYLAIALLISQILFLIVLSQVPTFLKNGFFPSYAALTFPFIITANSLWESLSMLNSHFLLHYLAWLETLFAITMTLFVFYKYLIFLNKTAKS